jgi:hypothetical protein
MAGKRTPPLPPSPEARAEVLKIIRSTAEPLAARDLAKLLRASCTIATADLASILDECVATGMVRAYPPKSANSKPRYWDRDAHAMCRAAALDAIQQAECPVTAKELLRRLAVPLKFTEVELTQLLDGAVTEGKLHAIPPGSPKGKPRYWHRNALEFGRIEILKALDERGPQSESALKKTVKGFSDIDVRQMIQNAIAAGEIWRHPPFEKVKKELFGCTPPSPEPYLRDAASQLTKVVPQLLAAGVPPEELRRSLVQLIEAAGVRFAQAEPHGRAALNSSLDGSVDLIALMRRIEPGADRGALVVSRDLRRVAKLEKQLFDRAVLELARQGRLSLHRHDFPSSLSPAERDELVTDGAGAYYVGMALRQNAG